MQRPRVFKVANFVLLPFRQHVYICAYKFDSRGTICAALVSLPKAGFCQEPDFVKYRTGWLMKFETSILWWLWVCSFDIASWCVILGMACPQFSGSVLGLQISSFPVWRSWKVQRVLYASTAVFCLSCKCSSDHQQGLSPLKHDMLITSHVCFVQWPVWEFIQRIGSKTQVEVSIPEICANRENLHFYVTHVKVWDRNSCEAVLSESLLRQ